jgi:hypothetical protein
VVRNGEPGSSRAREDNAPDSLDDDRLRDHHIEEMLSTFKDAARMRDSGLPAREERLD